MGFFSWKTSDTKETIWNRHSGRATFPVYMIDHEGNVWREENYEGYGEFGGKDYYDLLAEMNGLGRCGRDAGVPLSFAKHLKGVRHPRLLRHMPADPIAAYKKYRKPAICNTQGFFQ